MNAYFNIWIFWKWIIAAFWHGLTIYFGCVYGLDGPIDETGKTYSHWFKSCVAFNVLMNIITYKLQLETECWTSLGTFVNVGCLFFYYGSVIYMNTDPVATDVQPQINGIMFEMFEVSKFWIVILVLPFIALLPDLTFYFISKLFYPSVVDCVLRKQKTNPDYVYKQFKQEHDLKEIQKMNLKNMDNLNDKSN